MAIDCSKHFAIQLMGYGSNICSCRHARFKDSAQFNIPFRDITGWIDVWRVNLHDDAEAGLAQAAAFARFAARVLDWLRLDDGSSAGGGAAWHFAVWWVSVVKLRINNLENIR
jgi:hypothetical protein